MACSMTFLSFINVFEHLIGNNTIIGALLWLALVLGVFKLTIVFLSFGSLLASLTVLPSTSYKRYGLDKGAYALITGASDGIGKEFAVQLAERGFNLLLVSRTLSKLEAIQKELRDRFGIDVRILALDIARDDPANYSAVQDLCADLPVTILINNVGQSHSIPVPFLETTEQELRNIITINTTATLLITKMVAPKLVHNARSLGCHGLILTMGSFAGLVPSPLLAVYSGSKAFLQNWSSALATELASDNVDVQLVVSYLVTSAMSKIRRTSALIPNPRQFVSSTLSNVGRRVGAQERFATITPYWSHALYHFAIVSVLGAYSKLVSTINYKGHLDVRKRALRKAALAKKD
ncbi:HDR037Wp [Eremothecium sinecaudum]|uniref:Very-long-chain 3-oxoacyl-CoA reductase n=1 Tax=Eremothecium sinecaudum TaxID=45286 RepID=A0A0X8HST4_9SACH|nr:HDR037Wp [Eremothecium sinecaudum]AMD20780.1 HDR037Wp [Eremothecium sinecaudum]